MLSKTQAIVLYQLKYSDSSIIVNLYTLDFGRLAIMIGGLSSKRSRNKLMYFSPLNLLDIEIDFKEKRQIQRARNFAFMNIFNEIPYQTGKTTISLFLAEVLSKSLREQESNPMLFSFLESSILFLDHIQEGFSNFHLLFLLQFSRFLGIWPENNYSASNRYFNLQKGRFRTRNDLTIYQLNEKISLKIHELLKINYSQADLMKFNRYERSDLLKAIIQYFELHLEGFGEIKSLKILNEIFNENQYL